MPLVWPIVTYTDAMNLCMFSITSFVMTSGHPCWFRGLVITGRKTSCATVERCSKGASPKSPKMTFESTLSGSSLTGASLRKHSAFFLNLSGGFVVCAWAWRAGLDGQRMIVSD